MEEALRPSPALSKQAHRLYRSVTMRAQYLSHDRADIAFATKECARWMHAPEDKHLTRLKRIGRYLIGKPRVIQVFKPQKVPTKITSKSDTDHAGCVSTRKSSSGTALFHGRNALKTISTTQATLSLSSGESEYSGLVKATSAGLGMQSMAEDMGYKLELDVETDSNAAKGMASRRGIGKVRHLASRLLWIQQVVAERLCKIFKIPGKLNVADLLTKHLPAADIDKCMQLLGCYYPKGVGTDSVKIVNV